MAQTNKSKLYDLVDDIKIAMLTTIDGRGTPHTRPMANQKADRSGAIWFFTDKDGSVAANIKSNPKLTLGYAASGAYVSLGGRGEMVDDRAKIAASLERRGQGVVSEGQDRSKFDAAQGGARRRRVLDVSVRARQHGYRLCEGQAHGRARG